MPLETVNTVTIQDREYGQDGNPLVNQEVTIRLAPGVIFLVPAGQAGNADQVALQAVELRVKTDATGFWSTKVVRNSDITPANTYYSVKVGLLKTYDIAVPAGAGPFIASNILTGPLPVFPGGSSVAGPITITGNLTVTGTGTFSGALAANAGLAVVGGGNVAGGWTIAGLLTMSDAASRLVPGATSFSIRDNANLNDNLIVTNAGNVTVRGSLTVTAGPLTVSAGGASITGDETLTGRLVMGQALAKIVGGATQLSLRNNADTADNAVITDAGLVTLRNALSIPGAAGIAAVVTGFGSVPILLFFQDMNGIATATFNNIPQGFGSLLLVSKLRHNAAVTVANVGLRMNNDSTNLHYYSFSIFSANANPTYVNTTDQTQIDHALISAGTTNADFATSVLLIPGYAQTDSNHNTLQLGSHFQYLTLQGGVFTPASAAAITRLDTNTPGANCVAGSKIWVYGLA